MVTGTAQLREKPGSEESPFAARRQPRALLQLRTPHGERKRPGKMEARFSLVDQEPEVYLKGMESVGGKTVKGSRVLLEFERQRTRRASRERRVSTHRHYRRFSDFKGEQNAAPMVTGSRMPPSETRSQPTQPRRESFPTNSIEALRRRFEGRVSADSVKRVALPREARTEDTDTSSRLARNPEAANAGKTESWLVASSVPKNPKDGVRGSLIEEQKEEQSRMDWNEFSAQSRKGEVSNTVLETSLEPTARVSLIRRLWKHLEERREGSTPAFVTFASAKPLSVSTESNWMLVNGRWVVRDRGSTADAFSQSFGVCRQPSNHLRNKPSSALTGTPALCISPPPEPRARLLKFATGVANIFGPCEQAAGAARKTLRPQEKLRPREHIALWGRTLSVAATRLRASQTFTKAKPSNGLFAFRHGRAVPQLRGEASSASCPSRKGHAISGAEHVSGKPLNALVEPGAVLEARVSRITESSRPPLSINSTRSYSSGTLWSNSCDQGANSLERPCLKSPEVLRTDSADSHRSNSRNAPQSYSTEAPHPYTGGATRSDSPEALRSSDVITPISFSSKVKKKLSFPTAAASPREGISSFKTLSLHQVTESRLPPPTLRLSTKKSNPTIRERYCSATVSPASQQEVFWETHTDAGRRLTQTSESIRFSAFSVPVYHCSKTAITGSREEEDTTQNHTGGMSQFSSTRFRFKQFFKQHSLFDIGKGALSKDVLKVNDVLSSRIGRGKPFFCSATSWDDEAECDASDSGQDEEPTPRVGYKFSSSSTPKGPIGPRSVLKRYTPSTHLPECEGQQGELLRRELFIARRRVLASRRAKSFYGLFRTFQGPVKIRSSHERAEKKNKTEKEGSSVRLTGAGRRVGRSLTTKPFLMLSTPGDLCAVSNNGIFPTMIYHDLYPANLESPMTVPSFQGISFEGRAPSWCSSGSGSSVFTVKADELIDDDSNDAMVFGNSRGDDQSSTLASFFFFIVAPLKVAIS